MLLQALAERLLGLTCVTRSCIFICVICCVRPRALIIYVARAAAWPSSLVPIESDRAQDTANIQTSTAVQQTLYRFAEHLSDARSLQILIALRSWWLASLARRDAPPVSASLLTSLHAVAVHAVRSAGLRRAVAEAMNEVLGALLSDAWAGCAAARATPCAETTDVMETYFMVRARGVRVPRAPASSCAVMYAAVAEVFCARCARAERARCWHDCCLPRAVCVCACTVAI